MGLFTSKMEKHKLMLARAALEMLAEDERVYRNQVALFATEYRPAAPSPMGLLKARLHSCAFPAFAFNLRWGSSRPEDSLDELNALSGFALSPIVGSGALSVDEVQTVGRDYFFSQLEFIGLEMSEGPSQLGTGELTSEQLRELSTPGALCNLPPELGLSNPDMLERFCSQGPVKESLTAGFRGLVDGCHEAFVDSVGQGPYENAVRQNAVGRVIPEGIEAKARPRFARLFKVGISSRLRTLLELRETLK